VARSQHASGIVTDSETGETIVVTAGGLDDGDSLDSTEILIDNTWIMGNIYFYLPIFVIDCYSFS
jgi:methionyl-tRNA formyltransferase